MGAGSVGGLFVGLRVLQRACRRTVYDMDLVHEKVTRIAYRAELRLAVYAPASAPRAMLKAQLDRVAAAYLRYNLAAGNGFVSAAARSVHSRPPPAGSARVAKAPTRLDHA